MIEQEEFLTEKDIKQPSLYDIESMNRHPVGDDCIKKEGLRVEIDEDQIGFLPDGQSVYRSDNPGEMYRSPSDVISEDLLKQTPEKEIFYLSKNTEFRQSGRGKFFKGGRICEEIMVKRVLGENDEWKSKKGFYKYMSMTEFQYWFVPNRKYNDTKEFRKLAAGEIFSAEKTMENKEKKKEMMEKAKRFNL